MYKYRYGIGTVPYVPVLQTFFLHLIKFDSEFRTTMIGPSGNPTPQRVTRIPADRCSKFTPGGTDLHTVPVQVYKYK